VVAHDKQWFGRLVDNAVRDVSEDAFSQRRFRFTTGKRIVLAVAWHLYYASGIQLEDNV
jgi:hypothetical protein